jgi:hypothetical protein
MYDSEWIFISFSRILKAIAIGSIDRVSKCLQSDDILVLLNDCLVSLAPVGVALRAARWDVSYYEHVKGVSEGLPETDIQPI